MAISERFCAGFALAATVAGDRDAERAQRGLSATIAPALLTTVRALGALTKQERRERVRALLQPTRLVWPPRRTEPLRAYALLAQREATHALPDWVRTAPLPRAGYQPPPQLLALLWRSAQRSAL